MNVEIVSGVVFFINLICGYWRVQTKKFSIRWLIAVHLPIPFVIFLRVVSGIGWQLLTFPVFVVMYFAGQYLGGKVYMHFKKLGH